MVFKDATTYTCILGLSKGKKQNLKFKKIKPTSIFDPFSFEEASYSTLSEEKWNLQSNTVNQLFEKLYKLPFTVKKVFAAIRVGVDSGDDDLFQLKGNFDGEYFRGYSEKLGKIIEIEKDLMKPLLRGEDIKKYAELNHNYYMIYPHEEVKGKTKPISEEELKLKYPRAFEYFSSFKEMLIERKIRKKTNPKYWYSLHRSRAISLFEQEKIITPEISFGTNMTLDKNFLYHNTKCYSLVKNSEYDVDIKVLLAILNSKVLWFFLKSTGYVLRGGFFTFKTKYLEPFPLPNFPKDEMPYIQKVDKLLELNKDLHKEIKRFHRRLNVKLSIDKLSKKLQSFYEHDFKTFNKEVKKALNKQDFKSFENDFDYWDEVFFEKKDEITKLQSSISQIERQLDQMVYELYNLTLEEINIIEHS